MTPGQADRLLQRVQAELADKRPIDALRTLRQIARPYARHPAVVHLTALALKGIGDKAAAEEAFRTALAAQPTDPDINGNFANLLSDMGRLVEALPFYDRAVAAAPERRDLALNRAIALAESGRLAAAEEALNSLLPSVDGRVLAVAGDVSARLGRTAQAIQLLQESLRIDPTRPSALTALAGILRDEGDYAAALDLYRQALSLHPGQRALILAVADTLERVGEPIAAIDLIERHLASGDFGWEDGLAELARMRSEAGQPDIWAGYERALHLGSSPTLWRKYAELVLLGSGPESAANILARAVKAGADASDLVPLDAEIAIAGGDKAHIRDLLDRVTNIGGPTAIRLAIAAGDPARGEKIAAARLGDAPEDIMTWSLRSVCWRLLGDPRESWLHREGALIRTVDFHLAEAELTALAEVLRSLHLARSRPLAQSVRGGTQTRGSLFARKTPVIRDLLSVVESALADYWDALGPPDPRHPILKHRGRPLRIAGSWSVRLIGGGHHASHVHPEGFISSACHIVVPDETDRLDALGVLEIGGAPPDLQTGLSAMRLIVPKAGTMVLFPSTLFHGTRPFEGEERLTVAFDAS